MRLILSNHQVLSTLIGFSISCFISNVISPGVVTTAPMGNPLPIPFAIVTISGMTSCPSKPQKWLPVRPNPVWTCQVQKKTTWRKPAIASKVILYDDYSAAPPHHSGET